MSWLKIHLKVLICFFVFHFFVGVSIANSSCIEAKLEFETPCGGEGGVQRTPEI